MPYVQFVLPDLGYTAAAKQLSLIAPAFDKPGWSSGVYPLTQAGRPGPFADALRESHVTVLESTGQSVLRWFGLRFLIPAPGRGLVHAFGLKVLRRLRIAKRCGRYFCLGKWVQEWIENGEINRNGRGQADGVHAGQAGVRQEGS